MASRSAKQARGRKTNRHAVEQRNGIAAFLSRHRRVVGAVTGFAVAFSYVAANAIWYQPHVHGGAFFATRPYADPQAFSASADASENETVIRIDRDTASADNDAQVPQVVPVPMPSPAQSAASEAGQLAAKGDPVVQDVQKVLSGLNLYNGDVDGLTGPQTRKAIENYRKMVGLPLSGEIDDQLLTQLGISGRVASIAPLPQTPPATDMMQTASTPAKSDPLVQRVQLGLRAFGNEDIEVDGVIGSRTTAAIREFQSLFGLPETGKPDDALYAKMREIGLAE